MNGVIVSELSESCGVQKQPRISEQKNCSTGVNIFIQLPYLNYIFEPLFFFYSLLKSFACVCRGLAFNCNQIIVKVPAEHCLHLIDNQVSRNKTYEQIHFKNLGVI